MRALLRLVKPSIRARPHTSGRPTRFTMSSDITSPPARRAFHEMHPHRVSQSAGRLIFAAYAPAGFRGIDVFAVDYFGDDITPAKLLHVAARVASLVYSLLLCRRGYGFRHRMSAKRKKFTRIKRFSRFLWVLFSTVGAVAVKCASTPLTMVR